MASGSIYRRLEKGRFDWPRESDAEQAITLTRRELAWLLDGLPIEQKKAHQPLQYPSMV